MKNQLTVAMQILQKVELPKIANEVSVLQAESLKPDPDVKLIVQCIERNPQLYTKFLMIAAIIANRPIKDASDAVSVLGIKGVFKVFFSTAVELLFMAKKDSELIVNHAIKVATAMAELSTNLKGFSAGDAYLYGLLYNIGYVVLSEYDPERYKKCYHTNLTNPLKSQEMEQKTFGTTGSHIGVYVAKKWRIPNSIYCGILFQNSDVKKCDKGENKAHELINLLNISRMIVAEVEDKTFVTLQVRSLARDSMNVLGINQVQYIRAQQRVQKWTEDLQSISKNFLTA